MVKKILVPVIILIAMALISGIIIANKKAPEKKPTKKNIPTVEAKNIQLQPLSIMVKSQGNVQPKYNTLLVAQVSGEIIKIHDAFTKGGIIKKGQVLAEIDPFNYHVQLEQAKATLASSQASLALEKAQAKVAEKEWKNISNVAPTDLALRKPQQQQAEASVKAAKASVKMAEKNVSYTKIKAPFDALIAQRDVSLGSFVGVGHQVARVMDVNTAEIRLTVVNDDLKFLNNNGVNAKVKITTTVGNNISSREGHIIRSEGLIDENSRMMTLVAEIQDPYSLKVSRLNKEDQIAFIERQKPVIFGSFVSVEIEGIKLNNAVRIPRSLIDNNKIATAVPTDKGHILRLKSISIFRHEGEQSIINNGLNDGDKIILSSLDFPVDNMPVQIKQKKKEQIKEASVSE